jgi:hypothetical protein
VQRLRPEIWQQNKFLFHHDNAPFHTSFFTREFMTKNNMTVVPHPLCFSLFPRLKIKLKGHHPDTDEVLGAESQTLLNKLTERNFQDAIKNWQKIWECCILAEANYFQSDGGQ